MPVVLAACLAGILVACPAIADDTADPYLAARERLVSAYQSKDYAAMQQAAADALDARPGYPNAIFNLSMSQVLAGNSNDAFESLARLASMQIDFGVEQNPLFEPLKKHPKFERYAEAMHLGRQPVGTPELAFELDDGDFIPEGIAVDGDTLYLGSIRHGDIVRVRAGIVESLLPGGDYGSVYGMRLAGDKLWFAAAATPQYRGQQEVAGTGLFALDLGSLAVVATATLPATDGPQILGDLLIGDPAGSRRSENGVLYTTDQMDGRVYRFVIESDAGGNAENGAGRFDVLLDRSSLKSPQGLAFDRDGRSLYVADYVRGLFRVSLADGSASRVTGPDAFSLYGIDGLYRHGDWLIAVQNGIRPHRVVALKLDDGGDRIVSGRVLAMNHEAFDEPNLGTIANDRFYFIANSHWNRFDADNELPDNLAGPIVLYVPLPAD